MLTVLASVWIYSPPAPRAAAALAEILVLIPVLRVMRLLLDPPFVPILYLLGAFFLADLVRHFASVVPLLELQIFLIEMLIGIAVLAWRRVARRLRPASAAEAVRAAERALPVAGGVLLFTLPIALVAGAAGCVRLALLLGAGVLGTGYLALVLYAGVRVNLWLNMLVGHFVFKFRFDDLLTRGPLVRPPRFDR